MKSNFLKNHSKLPLIDKGEVGSISMMVMLKYYSEDTKERLNNTFL